MGARARQNLRQKMIEVFTAYVQSLRSHHLPSDINGFAASPDGPVNELGSGSGDTVCKSTARRPIETVNAAVVEWIRRNVLTEDIVLEAIELVRSCVRSSLPR